MKTATTRSPAPSLGRHGHEPGAIVPGGNWVPLPAEEAERHQADDSTPDSIRIELLRRPLPPLDPGDLSGRLETAARLDLRNSRWPATLLGCASSPGNWTTTTEDSTTGRRIGLHVDNFDRLPYPRLHPGRRRLCLNLGPGPGPPYLLIADHDIQQICRTLHPHTEGIRRYVAAGHPLRCLRLRLDPSDGYIAPTEFLAHDGSTAGIDQPSVAAFCLDQPPDAS
ncbi:hypothetical protein [Streptomyces lydicus]|uniref:hypothetical protein n=1 Tax=Streptomyces lydicus TaxID=47763 RepID=UPI0037B38C4A